MTTTEYRIPIIPRGQGRPRATIGAGGKPRMYESNADSAWKREFGLMFAGLYGQPRALCGGVGVHVFAVFPRPQRLRPKRYPDGYVLHDVKPDADNVAKIVLDALGACGVWVDDAQVTDLRVTKRYAERDNGPRIMVWVRSTSRD